MVTEATMMKQHTMKALHHECKKQAEEFEFIPPMD
jgi:hypothetical protein